MYFDSMLQAVPSPGDVPGSSDGSGPDRGRSLAARVVHRVTGVRIDPDGPWTVTDLCGLGMAPTLAHEVVALLHGAPAPPRAAAILRGDGDGDDHRPAGLPPAIPLPSPAIDGLAPLGHPAAPPVTADRRRAGLRAWLRDRGG